MKTISSKAGRRVFANRHSLSEAEGAFANDRFCRFRQPTLGRRHFVRRRRPAPYSSLVVGPSTAANDNGWPRARADESRLKYVALVGAQRQKDNGGNSSPSGLAGSRSAARGGASRHWKALRAVGSRFAAWHPLRGDGDHVPAPTVTFASTRQHAHTRGTNWRRGGAYSPISGCFPGGRF